MTEIPTAEALSLAGQHLQAGRLAEAETICRQVLQSAPREPGAYRLLGKALKAQGRLEESVAAFRRVLEIIDADSNLQPQASSLNDLGDALQMQGRLQEAVEAFRRALAIQPNFANVENNLGNALQLLGRLQESVEAYRRALAIRPNYALAENNLSNALRLQDHPKEALCASERALAIQPNYAEAEYHQAIALLELDRLEESAAASRRALAIRPNFAEAEHNLGRAMNVQGKLIEAMEAFRRALEIRPSYAEAHSSLLEAQQYLPDVSLATLAATHAEWDQRHAAPLATLWKPHQNLRDPDRPIRLGFVSPNFGRHPVGHFLVGCFESLSQEDFEKICYSDRPRKDDLTERFMTASETWRDIVGHSDEALAELIRSDRIDILFDLDGQTAKNRLLTFGRKPAPIQITWLGYSGTTGLTAMDYLIADRFHVPEGTEKFYSEQIIRLPKGHVCFEPPTEVPAVGPLPASSQGHVTFGSFNNPAKVTPRVVEVWARILQRLPDARLVLKYRGLDDPGTRRRYIDSFEGHGVAPDRLDLLGQTPLGDMLDCYNRIDLALDPFPFSGGITTFYALWMGVPVITCPGETFAGRQSLSYLSNAGLEETIARDLSDYVELSVDLAKNLPRLIRLRSELRNRMARSPLTDGERLAENLTKSLRDVWRKWCEADGDASVSDEFENLVSPNIAK